MAVLRSLLRRRRPGPVAFVLSGGGNLGALQIGMLRALVERGVEPDLVLGCSVGAINGAAVADDPSPAGVDRIEQLWRSLDGGDLMPSGWLPHAVSLARRGEAIHDNEGLRRSLEGVLGARTFEDLSVPFQCVATDIAEVREHWFTSGPLVGPILASAALPAVYPAVEIDGVRYLDGAIVDDVPMGRAVELGATTVFVLQVGAFSRPRPEPRRPLDVAVQSYWLARHHRFKRELAALPDHVDLHVLPTGDVPVVRYNDFTRTADLIASARRAAGTYLDDLGLAGDDRRAEPAATSPPAAVTAAAAAAAGTGAGGSATAAVPGVGGQIDLPLVAPLARDTGADGREPPGATRWSTLPGLRRVRPSMAGAPRGWSRHHTGGR